MESSINYLSPKRLSYQRLAPGGLEADQSDMTTIALTDTESRNLLSQDDTGSHMNGKDDGSIHKPSSRRFRAIGNIQRRLMDKWSWKAGLYMGLYASLLVLVGNFVLLLVGCLSYGGIVNGIGTVAQGTPEEMQRLGTRYHILINILSTILLTSSNYAMQILCAPTREEIEKSHKQGKWLDIGLMSIRNLRHVRRTRAILWCILAFSSVPLHLFYNSAIFESTAGQDYRIDFVNYTDPRIHDENWERMDNTKWPRTYSSSYVLGYGDLRLFLSNVSFEIQLHSNWSVSLGKQISGNCGWKTWDRENDITVGLPLQLDLSTGTAKPFEDGTGFKTAFSLNSTNSSSRPRYEWPPALFFNVGDPPSFQYLCPDLKWLQQYPFQVEYALAKPILYFSKVQFASPFLIVVIIANVMKTVAIFLTLRTCSSEHIITVGDAVASFLEIPEPRSEGKCLLDKSKFSWSKPNEIEIPWRCRKKSFFFVMGGKRIWTSVVLTTIIALDIFAFSAADSNAHKSYNRFTGLDQVWRNWGTASKLIIPFNSTSFDSKTVLTNAFIANVPQVLLSLVYFSVNRIITSVCFAIEWNNYGKQRKSLRTTVPRGAQRSAHFLQLPYRWAIPLTIISGVLHWLLSQTLFLVRLEKRKITGELYPESICACGYSPLSLLVFTLLFLVLLVVLLALLLRKVTIYIPAAGHSSAVISAACHPPLIERDAHLREVQWGVVHGGKGEPTRHCSFTSNCGTHPQEGQSYA